MRQVGILLGKFDAALVEVPSGVILLGFEVILIFNFFIFQSWINVIYFLLLYSPVIV